jgi:hypothetical protein
MDGERRWLRAERHDVVDNSIAREATDIVFSLLANDSRCLSRSVSLLRISCVACLGILTVEALCLRIRFLSSQFIDITVDGNLLSNWPSLMSSISQLNSFPDMFLRFW